MAQGNFGNQCDTENFGDPVVLYDTFEDRWILTDFAFTLDGGGNVNPAIAFQCFAVSQSGDPVTGGWNFYSITVTDGLNDYPKFGIWTDGLYMSANLFGFPAGSASRVFVSGRSTSSRCMPGAPPFRSSSSTADRRLHGRPEQRAPADRHAATRTAESSSFHAGTS